MLAVSSPSQPNRVFHPVGGQHLERMHILAEIFHRILVPLYGSQDKALQQIRESTDRKCFLLYEDEMPAGVLVFKTVLTNEFAEIGIKNSIEIKSLFVDQSAQNSGRGLGSALVEKLKDEVEQLGIDYNSIHVTVSEAKGESLTFFTKKGFQVVYTWVGRYLKGVKEHLLSCPRFAPSNVIPIDGVAQKFDRLYRARAQEDADLFAPELVHIVHDAHSDDIHCLKNLSDGTFVSGSKDTCR
jgi:GNAT superfamily N-acetyltransferase